MCERIEDEGRGKGKGEGASLYLNLVYSRYSLGSADGCDFLDMTNAVIANANVARFALALQLLQRLPHELSWACAKVGAVDQEQIDIAVLACELLHALDKLRVRRRGVVAREEDLGRDVDLLAGDFAFLERTPDLGLVLVVLGSVDVAVACLEGLFAGRDAYLWGRLVHAEADLGDVVLGGCQRQTGVYAQGVGRHCRWQSSKACIVTGVWAKVA